MSDKLTVKEDGTLLKYLSANLQGWSRNKIKQRLQSGFVVVNGEAVSQHDHPLQEGDVVEVRATPKNMRRGTPYLDILYSDSDLVAINKPAGLLSVATPKETKEHALFILRNQLSRPNNPIKLWPVHRLDRDTSGVMLFATSHEMREAVAANWSGAEKIYMAVVEGTPTPPDGKIDQPLRLDEKAYYMHVGAHPDAQRAVTRYETQRTIKDRSLLKVYLDTGRQHQIRAHMAWKGYPVVGDPRYGKKGPRMGLHALSLEFLRPKTGERLLIQIPAPSDFMDLLEIPDARPDNRGRKKGGRR
ncbi:RluA family pseudouridine synthase [Myxococcota bacterium]|nr:RluA family pseudouridine synthase [Myxococcota bacterium]